ncbi:hypothetical protein [Methylobacterium sp. 092160098-2]|uniref:hypothetical protein n=1 Tax=Methylobacterium sp. 092160098-2 TaxID=3025129 RepID=UPI002381C251|nr:hypothetical protein [Methylobacterium sp. 092160098-2]MDE4914779.1 hypothetical protein [Methylobacterium sp. 092160098-2]
MRGLAMLAIAGAVLLGPTLARADERVSGECLISVGGRAYLDGPCSITLYPGGGFQASGRGRHPYFATLDIDSDSGGAQAFWNGVDAESHAHDRLGTVVRQGGCWVNADARVCAWRPGTRPRSEAPAPSRPPTAWTAGGSRKIDVPIVIGGSEKFDACLGAGHVVGLDPQGDGFLSVRSGPGGKPYAELDRLFNGNEVAICDEKGPWLGVVYGPRSMDCNTGTPWPTRMPYTGPCKAGWIHSRYVKVTAG